mmetsp:Transcript_9970/g.32024  ORF Transcript_9970/g.32024 Transcript_9970/m.32024 type:complete len:212 (+) Transcript_9970:1261-1896(+)
MHAEDGALGLLDLRGSSDARLRLADEAEPAARLALDPDAPPRLEDGALEPEPRLGHGRVLLGLPVAVAPRPPAHVGERRDLQLSVPVEREHHAPLALRAQGARLRLLEVRRVRVEGGLRVRLAEEVRVVVALVPLEDRPPVARRRRCRRRRRRRRDSSVPHRLRQPVRRLPVVRAGRLGQLHRRHDPSSRRRRLLALLLRLFLLGSLRHLL